MSRTHRNAPKTAWATQDSREHNKGNPSDFYERKENRFICQCGFCNEASTTPTTRVRRGKVVVIPPLWRGQRPNDGRKSFASEKRRNRRNRKRLVEKLHYESMEMRHDE